MDMGEPAQVELLVGVGYVGPPFVQRFLGRGGRGPSRLASSSRCPSRKLENAR